MEEHKRHKMEYLEFLKSCDFIKVSFFILYFFKSLSIIVDSNHDAFIFAYQASSQWRKVQHRLEADERCLRLEKIERFEIFQV